MSDAPNTDKQNKSSAATRDRFEHLVVVGSSAGGIGALINLVGMLPSDFPSPLIVAQHLDRRRESHLGEILSHRSRIPVRTVTEQEQLLPGVI